jgi:phosphate starvation-inducible protein PhoH and related proteins
MSQRKSKSQTISPRTKSQELLVTSIHRYPVTIAMGPAGTGKTFVAVNTAVDLFFNSNTKYDKIVVARPNIPTGVSLGSFPGDQNEKLESWLGPLLSNFRESVGKGNVETMIKNGQLVLQPIETIRGQSFERSLVLIDEAQNLCKEELIAVVTRLGEDSKMILSGDPDQSDRRDGGFVWLANFIEAYRLSAGIVRFSIDDIVRSDFVGAFVKALAQSNKKD